MDKAQKKLILQLKLELLVEFSDVINGYPVNEARHRKSKNILDRLCALTSQTAHDILQDLRLIQYSN